MLEMLWILEMHFQTVLKIQNFMLSCPKFMESVFYSLLSVQSTTKYAMKNRIDKT